MLPSKYDRTRSYEYIKFITEEYLTKHKHFHYLQWIWKTESITKVIKNAKLWGLGVGTWLSNQKRRERKRFNVKLQNRFNWK